MIPRNRVQDWFDRGFDSSTRTIFLSGDICEETVAPAIQALHLLDGEDEGRIEFWIASDGGEVPWAFGMYDAIRACECEVWTIAMAECKSCAPLILAAGDKRLCLPHTEFMVHDTEVEQPGETKAAELARQAALEKRRSKLWYDMLSDRTKLTADQWRKKHESGGDYYFNANQARRWGLVDKIKDVHR